MEHKRTRTANELTKKEKLEVEHKTFKERIYAGEIKCACDEKGKCGKHDLFVGERARNAYQQGYKQCPKCKANYPISWEISSHTCPPFLVEQKKCGCDEQHICKKCNPEAIENELKKVEQKNIQDWQTELENVLNWDNLGQANKLRVKDFITSILSSQRDSLIKETLKGSRIRIIETLREEIKADLIKELESKNEDIEAHRFENWESAVEWSKTEDSMCYAKDVGFNQGISVAISVIKEKGK